MACHETGGLLIFNEHIVLNPGQALRMPAKVGGSGKSIVARLRQNRVFFQTRPASRIQHASGGRKRGNRGCVIHPVPHVRKSAGPIR